MKKSLYKRKEMMKHVEQHNSGAEWFKDFILGGQDGLVNVLGIILGMAVATNDSRLVIIAGLSATFAESVSMGAVAFTSSKALVDYYRSQEQKEEIEIENVPEIERIEIKDIYYKKGFRGKLLQDIVNRITSNKKMWKDIMMKEELGLAKEFAHPVKSAIIVFLASLIGSFIPLTSFFFLPINLAVISSLIISAIALFITGAVEGRLTVGNWVKKGFQLAIIGMAAALVGFIIGKLTGYS
ncbi:MAG: VIT1/CCC1 transporter family protein [Candidatus Nanoarchaeia archaeon]|nr:VIT1/CCC1 transporter family protein [Candidatus Nanoarchaeia archaeon]